MNPRRIVIPHEDCCSHEPCKLGLPSTCPREPARELRRLAQRAEWSRLQLQNGEEGQRHYLDGVGVHCGAYFRALREGASERTAPP